MFSRENVYEQKGFDKEQLKSGLVSVRRMKILRRRINNLTYHWEYSFDSIPTKVSGTL